MKLYNWVIAKPLLKTAGMLPLVTNSACMAGLVLTIRWAGWKLGYKTVDHIIGYPLPTIERLYTSNGLSIPGVIC